MTQKLMHLSCLIDTGNLHDALIALERYGIANVEVRAVRDDVRERYGLQGSAARIKAKAVHAFWDSLAGSPDMERKEIHKLYVKAGFSSGGVNTALMNAVKRKQVRKKDRGLYAFPRTVKSNGAHP